ncbi:UDP-3-O-acyl-N-acetylglucosamine deacetylase [Leptolyngbya sp. FACHB-36]|uniref:UDP-3-O-acyl-N-acetylglucosamine deacetylase n=1 Tax=Leptolyngbya sp. FACHB-36 TaxID=2692808 RepID=UPI001680516C|nr:UDP-3-O-acyl-N-acetylglucosamine deacetylase [Leptolyngbya sp. FACHB-36]MBD2022164.1 UDP-3-O-acyl-N-acetylglucosamine deacetylase [Leptolyngbya sp. FACHB-36]
MQEGIRDQELGSSEVDAEPFQQTLAAEFTRSGIGLHTGVSVQVRVLPAPAGRGRYFARTDLPDVPEVPADINAVQDTTLSTEIGRDRAKVRTVEHLLASLAGMGIDNARIELDGPEVPLLDGSATEWVQAIAHSGIRRQSVPRFTWTVLEPVWVRDGDAFAAVLPAAETRFTYGIDFEVSAIGNQWHSWRRSDSFADELAPARTFGLLHQIDYLREKGLIKGGSLDNALVCGADGWINPPLRFPNEPARHKLLDLVGDLSLLGQFPIAHVMAYKASHKLHTQLARSLVRFRP